MFPILTQYELWITFLNFHMGLLYAGAALIFVEVFIFTWNVEVQLKATVLALFPHCY